MKLLESHYSQQYHIFSRSADLPIFFYYFPYTAQLTTASIHRVLLLGLSHLLLSSVHVDDPATRFTFMQRQPDKAIVSEFW